MSARIPQMRELVMNRVLSVYDGQFTKALREIPWESWHRENRPFFCRKEYLDAYREWILSSRLNRIAGLERFRETHLINGTTQTFDEAYFKHKSRRLRTFRGEYGYHRRVMGMASFLEDAPLEANDFAIVSAPFSATGSLHPGFYPLLDEAAGLGVPVIVDCAFFGTCAGFTLNLDHPAIESASFSLTKGLGLGDIRSGVRFSNTNDHNPICEQNRYDHTILAAARIGLYMMKRFPPDHIPTRFQGIQREVCSELGIEPSPCMHIALGGPEWDHFKVDGKYNTLGIRELVKARSKGLV